MRVENSRYIVCPTLDRIRLEDGLARACNGSRCLTGVELREEFEENVLYLTSARGEDILLSASRILRAVSLVAAGDGEDTISA